MVGTQEGSTSTLATEMRWMPTLPVGLSDLCGVVAERHGRSCRRWNRKKSDLQRHNMNQTRGSAPQTLERQVLSGSRLDAGESRAELKRYLMSRCVAEAAAGALGWLCELQAIHGTCIDRAALVVRAGRDLALQLCVSARNSNTAKAFFLLSAKSARAYQALRNT